MQKGGKVDYDHEKKNGMVLIVLQDMKHTH
jgi:hypothetical protein